MRARFQLRRWCDGCQTTAADQVTGGFALREAFARATQPCCFFPRLEVTLDQQCELAPGLSGWILLARWVSRDGDSGFVDDSGVLLGEPLRSRLALRGAPNGPDWDDQC